MLCRKYLGAALVALFAAGSAPVFAADCALNVTRTACPGQEKESFSKCDGKASCVETKSVASAAECAAAAKTACANTRQTVTKNKKVTASFGGAPVEGGKDFCAGHADYPYAAKQECK